MTNPEKNRPRKKLINGEEKLKKYLEERKSEDIEEEMDNEDVKNVRLLRRTKSITNSLSSEDVKTRRYQPDRPIHKPRDSLLSWSNDFNSWEGIINWGFLILCIGGIRLFLENVIKYGIRVNPVNWLLWVFHESQSDNYFHTPLWLLGSNLHYLCALKLEKVLSQRRIPSWCGWYLNCLQLCVIVVTPMIAFTLWPTGFSLLGRCLICQAHTIMFLKLWSYMQVNHWCRDIHHSKQQGKFGRSMSFRLTDGYKIMTATDAEEYLISPPASSSEKLVRYPDNLTLGDLFYFLAAPTLCYELNFPRTARIRKWFLVRRVVEVLVLCNLLLALFQQWMIPSVTNSFQAFSDMDFIRTWERLFKLSIPNHLLWLTWSYMLFHSFLNMSGELLRFADRHFYSDWWNARDLATFWRLWNLPVHKWAIRHLYMPVVRAGYSKAVASILVFFISALLHEYLISVPLLMHKVFVFLGMALQIPLIFISGVVADRFGKRWGNAIVWASLILGQPLGILVYFHDYAVSNIDIKSLTS